MEKKKIVGLVIGVLLFVLVVAGITYAIFVWTSDKIKLNVDSKCFNVYYEKGNDITGVMMPSLDYTGGLYTTVKMDVDSSCDINANGKLYINTLNNTSSNLYREGLLNYKVLKGNEEIINGSGSITGSGAVEVDLGVLSKNESANTTYMVYVWVDNELVQNSDIDSVYYGNISVEAIQFK